MNITILDLVLVGLVALLCGVAAGYRWCDRDQERLDRERQEVERVQSIRKGARTTEHRFRI